MPPPLGVLLASSSSTHYATSPQSPCEIHGKIKIILDRPKPNHILYEISRFMDSLDSGRPYGSLKKKRRLSGASTMPPRKNSHTPPSPVSPTTAIARSLPSVSSFYKHTQETEPSPDKTDIQEENKERSPSPTEVANGEVKSEVKSEPTEENENETDIRMTMERSPSPAESTSSTSKESKGLLTKGATKVNKMKKSVIWKEDHEINDRDIIFLYTGVQRRYNVIYSARLLVICLGVAMNCAARSLDDFYPFDIAGLDNTTEYKDDGGSGLIQLDIEFPFFNNTYSSLYVNNNGIISFGEKMKNFKPRNFRNKDFKDSIPIVAPFWADVDIENYRDVNLNESVIYRITNDSALLNKSTEDIRQHFTGQRDFYAKQMVIVTWYNVGFYGAAGEGNYKRNTFQAVLVTNSEMSFAIFNYYKIVWTTGSNSGGIINTGLRGSHPAVVGFSSEDPQQYYLLEYSGTDEIINISQRSNIGIPGKYIFRLDGRVVDHS